MRRIRNALLILLTAICIATGALLPKGMAILQDQQMNNRSETQELDPIQMLIQQELSPPRVG